MVEVYLIVTGVIFFAWLYALIRQTQQSIDAEQMAVSRPVVPVNLMDTDEAVVVAEGRGRIVYVNDLARRWFGIDGGTPNLTLMAQQVQPPDMLHDLFAEAGHATFRLGQRRIEAVSHTVPGEEGRRLVVIMREVTADALQAYSEFDPIKALTIMSDISQIVGTELELDSTVDSILRSVEQVVKFDSAEMTLWQTESQTLQPVGRSAVLTSTGSLVLPDEQVEPVRELGEGYSGWIAMYRQPLLVGDMGVRSESFPKNPRPGFYSFLGIPLLASDRFIGTLELYSRNSHAFGQRDLALLQAAAPQIAAAVESARLYHDQTTRVAELTGLQQIAEAMSQLGEPSELYGQLTQRIAHLVSVDVCGVLLYDEERDEFYSQPPFYGIPTSLIEGYRLKVEPDTELYGIWRYQAWWFTNDSASEIIQTMGFRELISAFEIHMLALIPMIVGARRIGLLVVANKRNQLGFSEKDMRILMSFASQAAVLSDNARLYAEEQRRTHELSGLQQIASAITVLRSPSDLYEQITSRVASLMNVSMCGVLLYDPKGQILISQQPFYGLDDEDSVNLYQLPSPPNSVVSRLWQGQDIPWTSNDVRHDPVAGDTDLARLSSVIGIRQTMIAPLVVGGNRLGILQVANKVSGGEFSEDDARVFGIFAGQAAILIDNARLYREMQRRTHEAEGLRAITEIASRVAPLLETVEDVIVAIANLLESQIVSIGLVNNETGELVIEPGYTWGLSLDEPIRLDAYASGFEDSVLISRRPFLSNNLRDDRRLLPQYRDLTMRLNARNSVQVPLVIQDRSIGELMVANKTVGEIYTDTDTQLLMAIATQVAAMVDRIRLYQATDQNLRSRVEELDALRRISRELSQTIELDRILDVIRQEALRSTAASSVSVVLLNPVPDWDPLEQPSLERRFGEQDKLTALAPVEEAAARGEMVIVHQYEGSAYQPLPENAQSALVAPVHYGEQVIGLIHLFSETPVEWDQRVIDFVRTLVDQAEIAVGNSRRYHDQIEMNRQLRVRAERMGRIFELGEMFRQGASLPELLEEVAHSVQETVGFNVVLVSLADAEMGVMRRTAQAGLPLAIFEEMQQISPSLEQARSLMQDAYRISNSYFLPAEGTADLKADLPVYQVLTQPRGAGPRAWDPQDLLLVPLYGSGDQLLGLMSVDEPRSGLRPDQMTVEALEIFASQAAFSIGNYRLVERIQQEAEATRRERDRLAQLHLVASSIQSAPDVPSRLQVVADGIHEAGWGRVVITLRDEKLEPTAMIQAGYSYEEALQLSDQVLAGRVWRTWINDLSFFDLKLGAGYYMRYNHPWVRQNVLRDVTPEPAQVPADRWHPLDVLYLPLVGQDQKRIIGIIEMTEPVDGHIPTEASLQPFELFASQAAAAIETTRLYLETVRAAEQEARLNEMMEAVSLSLSPQAVIEAVGRGLQLMVPFTRMSVALYDEETKQFELLLGVLALDGSVQVLQGDPQTSTDTLIGHIHREPQSHVYLLQREEGLRRSYQDVTSWYESGERSTLVVPMISGGQAVGVLHLGSELENAFGFQENLDLIQRLANLSAVALDNARLFQQSRQRTLELDQQAQRLGVINRVSGLVAQTLDPMEIYQISLTELRSALRLQSSSLMLIDGDVLRLALGAHSQNTPLPDITTPVQGNPVLAQLVETRQPVRIADEPGDAYFEAMRAVLEPRGIKATLTVPMLMGEQVIGMIGLDSDTLRVFSDAEVELATTIANQSAVAIEKARLFNEAQRRAVELDAQAKRLGLLNRVSMRMAQTLDLNEIYSIVLSELADMLDASFAGLMLFEGDQGRLVLDYPFDHPTPNYTISLVGNKSIEYVRETFKPLVSEDVLHDPMFEAAWEVLEQRGTKSLMIVPLIVGESILGTIGLDSTYPRTYSESEVELAQTIANQASTAMEKARLYNETLGLTIFNQAVVESIQQGIVVLDRDLIVRRVNHFMLTRYGWETEAVGQSLFDYRPDYDDFLRRPIAVALGVGEPQAQYEVERLDPSGQKSIRNYYVYPMLEARTVTGIVLLVEDVTARALLEADLNARAIQMAALSEVSGQITSTLDPNQVINLILDALDRVVPYDGVSLWLRATDRDELDIVAARGYQDPDSPKPSDLIGLTVEIQFSPLFREMAEKAQVIDVGDVSAGDPRFPYGSAAVYKNWLGAPLVSKGNVVGVLALEKRDAHFYTALHEQLALTFANQAAVALDNAQLFQETRARAIALDEQAQRLALLNRVSLALAQSLDLENIYEIALREAAIALGLTQGTAMQIESSSQLARVIVDYPRGDAPPERVYDISHNEALRRVLETLIPLSIEDLDASPQWESMRQMVQRQDVVSVLLVPLVVGGDVIGVLRLDAIQVPRQFTSPQIELAQTIASQAAIAAQNASLFEQASVRTRELETLFESAQATAVTLDLNEVVRRVTIQMLSALRSDACTVFLWDDISNRLEVRGDLSARPDDVQPVQPGDTYSLADYPLREKALRRAELIVVRADEADIPPGEMDLMQQHHAASRMLIPLVVNEMSIGLVEIETFDPNRYFKSEDIRMARTLGSQAAISIENARLQTETRRTVEELYIINDMSAALSSANSLESLLEVIDYQLPNLNDAELTYIALYDGITDTISFPLAMRQGEPIEMSPYMLGDDEFSFIIKRQTPLLLTGDTQEAVRRNHGITTRMPDVRAFLGVPLLGADAVLGVLAVSDSNDALAFNRNDQRILATVGSQLAVALQNVRLLHQTLELAEELEQRVRARTSELEQERQHISTLYQITTGLSTSLETERLLNSALQMVAESVNATHGAILDVDPVGEVLNFRARVGWASENGSEVESVRLNQGLAGWAVLNKQNLIVDNVQDDPRWVTVDTTDEKARGALLALIQSNEETLGVITLYSDRPGAFNQDHLRLVVAAASQVANAMNNAELYTMIRDQAERLGTLLRQEQVEATKSGSILESVADGVIVVNSDGQVIVFNSAAERILRISSRQALNQPVSIFVRLYGESISRWFETINEWMSDPLQHQMGDFFEDRIELEDGRVISVRLSPVRMGDQFLGTVSVFRDITREVEVDRLKSEFVATVSHELRTPMTSIKGYADLLLLGAAGDVSDSQQRFLETIKQNADRLSVLVNDLLDISRIDQGHVELKFGEIDVEDLLNVIADHLRDRSDDRKQDMDVTTRLPDDRKLTIWGDYEKVVQILNNLADNAFNYTPAGGSITLSAWEDEETNDVILSVADTGIGIAPEVADRVFERFFRGDETHELVMDTPGTGLGLAIAREFVQIHSGQIWFESEVGKGTTFFVRLPAQKL